MKRSTSRFAFGAILAAGVLLFAAPLSAQTRFGRVTGVVLDPGGTPQMGATVWLHPEGAGKAQPIQLYTNVRGAFAGEKLLPGVYTVRVTLAGFLPSVQRDVKVAANITTALRIELDSVFTSLDRLRRQPNQKTDSDEWAWVLRASTATRPVLRYAEDESSSLTESRRRAAPRGKLEVTSGGRRKGSTSNLPDAASTAFAYDQSLGRTAKLVVAGQASYERATSAGFSTTWMPAGDDPRGPRTSLTLRRADLGPDAPMFRGVRLDHSGTLGLGDRIELRYGGEYILVGLGRSVSSFRPRGELSLRLTPDWTAKFIVAPRPLPNAEIPSGALDAAIASLDAFPALMKRDGRPVLESGWHDEISVEHSLGPNSRLIASVFRDRARHAAVFGRGLGASADVLEDYYSGVFAYDGGESQAWGLRMAYSRRFGANWESTVIYSWAGALAPLESAPEDAVLRDRFATRNRHSFTARVGGKMGGTQMAASYKWISGPVVSRLDSFAEAAFQVDPYLNVSFRQPLPRWIFPGRVEAIADFHNLLAQGYVPVSTADGQILLIPAARAFRGGLSFQF